MAAGTDCRAPALRCAATSTWASLQVHGDVFRPPRHLEVLAALVGTGVQLALLVLSVILITIAGACPWRPGWRASRVGLAGWAWLYAGRCCLRRHSMHHVLHMLLLLLQLITQLSWSPHCTCPTAGTLFVERGTIVTVFIICYALTSFVGG